jgi:CubicO group peptidase (beta-lactamase class C family)
VSRLSAAEEWVQIELEALTGSGKELGVQVAAYLDGELVVDAWSGVADTRTGRPVDGDTLFNCFSVAKGVSATLVHLLADRGVFGYETPISSYWPEFAAAGKGRATIRHALTHSVGIPDMPSGVTVADLCDWDKMCRWVASAAPLWEPGTATGYHSWTYSWIIGETVYRASGRRIGEILRTELAGPLGVADSIFYGIPADAMARYATLENGNWLDALSLLPADAPFLRSAPLAVMPSPQVGNRPDFLGATLPSTGVMTARGIARIYAALGQGGELDGVRLMSPDRIAMAAQLITDETDRTLGRRIRRGLGYHLGGGDSPMSSSVTAFGHSGSGGNMAFADPAQHFAYAFARNRMVLLPAQEDPARLISDGIRRRLDR